MKNELLSYATSLKENGLQRIPSCCFWILLSIFLIPILSSNIMWGLILPCSFVLLYFSIKRESNIYRKDLLRIGLFLLFLGIEFSFLTTIQYECIITSIIAIGVSLISYEILFLVKIQKKVYSSDKHNKSVWINVIPLIFGGTGIWAGKLIAKSENNDIKLWILILISSLLIVYSFTFFQKFFIHKILN